VFDGDPAATTLGGGYRPLRLGRGDGTAWASDPPRRWFAILMSRAARGLFRQDIGRLYLILDQAYPGVDD